MSAAALSGVLDAGPLRVGSHSWDLDSLDHGAALHPSDLDLKVIGMLPLSLALREDLERLDTALEAAAGTGQSHTFFNGPCLVFTEPPAYDATTLRGTLGHSWFFAKAMARGGLPANVVQAYRNHYGFDPRQGEALFDGPHDPMRFPAAGISVLVTGRLAADPRAGHGALLARRSAKVAAAGQWAPAVGEAFSLDDITATGALDVFAAAHRGLWEEAGLTPEDGLLTCLGAVRYGGDIQGYGLLFRFALHEPLDYAHGARIHAPDTAEHDALQVIDLQPETLATLLTDPETVFSPVVPLMVLRSLEQVQPGGVHQTVRLMSH